MAFIRSARWNEHPAINSLAYRARYSISLRSGGTASWLSEKIPDISRPPLALSVARNVAGTLRWKSTRRRPSGNSMTSAGICSMKMSMYLSTMTRSGILSSGHDVARCRPVIFARNTTRGHRSVAIMDGRLATVNSSTRPTRSGLRPRRSLNATWTVPERIGATSDVPERI